MHVVWKAWAFFRRDLLTDLSYKLSFALQALHILLGIAAYYFLASLLGESTPGGYAPYSLPPGGHGGQWLHDDGPRVLHPGGQWTSSDGHSQVCLGDPNVTAEVARSQASRDRPEVERTI